MLFTVFAPLLATVALSFGPPEIFALMLLAFATFVGLGGDDIPKTIFSICLGLVFAAVGFDEISGEPRLVFFDISGFLHGINFLVLAIGVYGIGEMLWTIESTRGKITSTEAKMTVKGIVADAKEGDAARLEGHRHRVVPRLLRRHPARRRGDARLADGLRRSQDWSRRTPRNSARAIPAASRRPRRPTTRPRPGRCCRC